MTVPNSYKNLSQATADILVQIQPTNASYTLVRNVIIGHMDMTLGDDALICQNVANPCIHLTAVKSRNIPGHTVEAQVPRKVKPRHSYQINPYCYDGLIDEVNKQLALPKPANAGARQQHGFINELRVVNKHDLTHMVSNYTAKWDAYTKETGTPVSVKFKQKGGSVEMADFFRQSEVKEDFYLHVSFWEGSKKELVSEHILLMPGDVWSSFFTDIYHDDMRRMLHEASNDHSYDLIWKEKCQEIKEKWDSVGSIIKLAPKRDHKSQKRMQCVIPYEAFMELDRKYSVQEML